jgi:hypothetical protein
VTVTVAAFTAILNSGGSNVGYHRETGGTLCPCLTPEGFRDPLWHVANPGAPVCNANGLINVTITSITVKGFVQPLRSAMQRISEDLVAAFGEIQVDDHVGVFPITWAGTTLNFRDWPDNGPDYVSYDGRRYTVVGADKLADIDGDPNHHWETALRLISG